MSVTSVAKLKYILPSLIHKNEGAIAAELEKLSVGLHSCLNFRKARTL